MIYYLFLESKHGIWVVYLYFIGFGLRLSRCKVRFKRRLEFMIFKDFNRNWIDRGGAKMSYTNSRKFRSQLDRSKCA
jgi:hypothetical protein